MRFTPFDFSLKPSTGKASLPKETVNISLCSKMRFGNFPAQLGKAPAPPKVKHKIIVSVAKASV